MDKIRDTSLKNKLAETLDKVTQDHKPILITRQNGDPAVVMSLKEFQSYQETMDLMASPKNAMRLNAAIEEIESGNGKDHELIEE